MLVAAGLLLTAGVIIYANSFAGVFLYDDVPGILQNPYIRRLWPPWRACWSPEQSPLSGRPIPSFSLAVNYALGGFNVWGYHAFNLGVHLAAGLALLGVIRRTLGGPALRGRFGDAATLLAAIITITWVVHPLQTEAVSYLVQRTELLVGLFYLLTLYCAIRAWDSPHELGWSAAAVLCCLLGMGSKEVMVSAPLMVLLYDRTLVSGSWSAALRRHGRLYAGLAGTWLLLAVLIVTNPRTESAGFSHHVGVLAYLRTQCGVVAHYLRLAFWPNPLLISYRDWPIAGTLRAVAAPAAGLGLLLAATIAGVIRRRPLALLGAWCFLILAPSSSVVPIVTEIAAERRMYLPLAGVITFTFLYLYTLVSRLPARGRAKIVLAVIAVPLTATLGWRTAVRNQDYHSALAMWQDMVRRRPGNADARNHLGIALLQAGDLEAARRELVEAVRLEPEPLNFYNLALSQERQGDLEGAIASYTTALRMHPDYFEAHMNLASVYARQKRIEQSMRHLQEAVRIRPNSAPAHDNLGLAYRRSNDPARAAEEFRRAAELDPGFAKARINLGRVLIEMGRWEEGLTHLEAGLRQQPNANMHLLAARVLAEHGRAAEAAAHQERARRLQSGGGPGD